MRVFETRCVLVGRAGRHLFGASVAFDNHLMLEKSRDVVDDGRDDDADEKLLCAVDAAHSRIERPTDGHVPVDGDQQHRPDGHRLRDRRYRPHVALGVRKVRPQHVREPVGPVICNLVLVAGEDCLFRDIATFRVVIAHHHPCHHHHRHRRRGRHHQHHRVAHSPEAVATARHEVQSRARFRASQDGRLSVETL